MTNVFFGGMQKSQFHFIHTPCTNGTWLMYEIEMAFLRPLTTLPTIANILPMLLNYTSYKRNYASHLSHYIFIEK